MKHCPRCQKTYADTQRFCLDDGDLLSLRDPYHLVGRTLAEKYRIDALVGVGGMGAVYSAYHLGLDRRVAFKILLPHLALGNIQTVTLFEREGKIAGRLSHENIVSIFDAGRTSDEIAYIAMEWLDGRTLADELMAQGQFSFERAAEILRQIALALEEAHTQRVIHRDLKPSNVMLVRRAGGRDRVKVLDFGIGKVMGGTAGAQVSSVMGTPHYASPEQFQVGTNIDGRADIYSLGVILYEMLTTALPFNATSVHELIRVQMTEPPVPLREIRPDAPLAVEQLLARLLDKNPEQRPQHVSEIPELFERALKPPAPRQTKTVVDEEPAATMPYPSQEQEKAEKAEEKKEEQKVESPSIPPVVSPTPRPETEPLEARLTNKVEVKPVSIVQEPKETQRVQKVITSPELEPSVAPSISTQPPAITPRAASEVSLLSRLDWRHFAGGGILLVVISVLLWLVFGGSAKPTSLPASLPANQSQSTPTPSPTTSASPSANKAPVSSGTIAPQATPASEKTKPTPKRDSEQNLRKEIDKALGKDGK